MSGTLWILLSIPFICVLQFIIVLSMADFISWRINHIEQRIPWMLYGVENLNLMIHSSLLMALPSERVSEVFENSEFEMNSITSHYTS